MAFQSGAFQQGAFQGAGAAPQQESPRYVPAHRDEPREFNHGLQPASDEELRKRRDAIKARLDPPAKAERVVERAAKRAIEKSRAFDGQDALQWLRRSQEEQEKRLKAELKQAKVSYEQSYMQWLLAEVALMLDMQVRDAQRALLAKKEQDEEDEQIVMLLMEVM